MLVVVFHKDETGEGKDIQSLIKSIIYEKTLESQKSRNIPSCGDKKEIFSYSPVDLNIVERVTPQGEFGPSGGHVFPVKHVYFLDEYSPKIYSTAVNRPKIEMVAPADMWITQIQKYWDKDRGDEYYLYFSPCKEISGAFFHMSDISPKLKQEFEKNKENKKDIQDRGQTIFETVTSNVLIDVKAGEVIGYASIKSSQMFDFNLIDTRAPELDFINKERFAKHRAFDLLHEVCPYDYFTEDIRNTFYSKISDYRGYGVKRTVEPLCGEYMQDLAGTAQGVWFRKGTAEGELGKENIIERELLHLALAHETYDPQRSIFSIGELTGLEPLSYYIQVKEEGLINRDWKDITSDGKIYCFDFLYNDNSAVGKSIILKMPTDQTLMIELIDYNCNKSSWSFTDKAVEFER